MNVRRRDLLKLGALAGAAGLAPAAAMADASAEAVAVAPTARAEHPLRMLILGGTGFIGPHQVRYALARGHRLTLFNRGRSPIDWPGEVEVLIGDREAGDVAALAGREWDVCIDNPAGVPHWVRDVGRVLHGRVGHYLFVSTVSVYADNARPGQDETAATAEYPGPDAMVETRAAVLADMSLYGPLKAACERQAEFWFPGIVTVVRPGLIVGPGDQTDRFTYWPVRLARGGEVVAPGDGEDPVQIVDLAEWTVRMAERRAFGTFNALGPDYVLSMAAMLYGIRAVVGTAARLHWLPTEFLREQGIVPWRDMPAWVPGVGDSAGFARRSNARAIAMGLDFRPLANTVADTLAWFREQPEARRASLRAGLSAEREAVLLERWKTRSASSPGG